MVLGSRSKNLRSRLGTPVWKRGKTTRESLSATAGVVCFLAKLPLIRGRVCGFSARHRRLVLPITTFDDEAVFSCSSVNWFFEESFNSSSRSSFSEASVEPKAGTLVAMAETSPISSSFQEPQVSLLSEGTTPGFPSFFCNVISLLFQISLYLSRLFLESLS